MTRHYGILYAVFRAVDTDLLVLAIALFSELNLWQISEQNVAEKKI